MSEADERASEDGSSEPSSAEAGAWALADDAVLAAVKAQLLGSVDVPVRLGKYEIERPIGSGAMGRILLARDPQLDRRVALKIVAPQLADVPEARTRIVREARAMARLSDPHVAQVYEVAEEGPHLFVAMEYVDGQRLGDWLGARTRSVARIVDVFIQAGRGLASTHAKGLVHRDFKPDNVMLEDGGRAKVVDFGLACGLGEKGGAAPSLESLGPLDASLTATGAWLGTPAYMAPEQWAGEQVDARSDQFSFCVALYEALSGHRPFEGETAASVLHAVRGGRPAPLRGAVRVPRRIEAAILRGLQADPARRWPAMEPLLRAMEPRSRATVAVVVPMVALVVTASLMSRDDPCEDAAAPMDTVWNDDVQTRLSDAMAKVDAPWTEPTRSAVTGHLERGADAWRQAARAVCAADDAPPESSRCLEYERTRLSEAIERMQAAGPGLLVSAASHLELLPDARTRPQPAATGWLRDGNSAVAGEGGAEGARTWSEAVDHLGALSTAAGAERYVAALASGRSAVAVVRERAEALGDRPRVAHAAWLGGRLALRDGDRITAERSFRDAMDLAMEVGESSLRAAATVELVYVVGNDGERTAEAITLADEAEAMLAALGDAPVWTARLAAHRASTLAHARPPRIEEAVGFHAEALELLRTQLGEDHPDVIMALGNLGAALRSTGRPAEAQARLQEAIERAQRVWGSRHPRTARLEGTLGLLRLREGNLEEARRLLERSLQVRARALGEDHIEVAGARFNFALVLRMQDHHAEAVEQMWQGLKARERARGVEDIGHVEWLLRIGVSELALGHTKEARTALWRALDLCERFGANANRFANLRVTLARAYAQEDPAKARVLAELARRAWVDDPEESANIDAFLATLAEPRADGVTAPR